MPVVRVVRTGCSSCLLVRISPQPNQRITTATLKAIAKVLVLNLSFLPSPSSSRTHRLSLLLRRNLIEDLVVGRPGDNLLLGRLLLPIVGLEGRIIDVSSRNALLASIQGRSICRLPIRLRKENYGQTLPRLFHRTCEPAPGSLPAPKHERGIHRHCWNQTLL
jgi:hypothetical protein